MTGERYEIIAVGIRTILLRQTNFLLHCVSPSDEVVHIKTATPKLWQSFLPAVLLVSTSDLRGYGVKIVFIIMLLYP